MTAAAVRPLAAAPAPGAADAARRRRVAAQVRALLDTLGLDLADPHLAETPARVARALEELFAGLRPDAEPDLRTFPNDAASRGLVAVTDVPFYSVCAHHLLPFFGVAHVGYLPGDRLVGLSKLARAVEYFARRPQVQERLTAEVADFLADRLRPAGVMVVLEGRHLCMEMRGVAKAGAVTTTTAARGAFADDGRRREFLDMLHGARGSRT